MLVNNSPKSKCVYEQADCVCNGAEHSGLPRWGWPHHAFSDDPGQTRRYES